MDGKDFGKGDQREQELTGRLRLQTYAGFKSLPCALYAIITLYLKLLCQIIATPLI